MARSEARIKVSIWTNEEFRSLTRRAQRTYLLATIQPTILLCGVVALTVGRWASFAADGTADDVKEDLDELQRHGFVIIDWDTEEVFVRSFMRNDGVWNGPKTRGAARDQLARSVVSKNLRKAIGVEMGRLDA